MPISFMKKKKSSISKFEALFSKYEKPLLYYIRSIIHDKSYEEDALQETFVQVYKNLDRIDEIDSDRTRNYLYVIAKNMAVDFNRRKKLQQDVTKRYDENVIILEKQLFMDGVFIAVINERLDESLEELSESDRDILAMKYGLELSDSEIANILHIKSNAARQRVLRARKRLAAIFNGRGEE